MACTTRQQDYIWLIGFMIDELPGTRLPSWAEVLQRYFKLHRDEKLEVKTAVATVVHEAMRIWEKARIPTAEERNIISKLERKVEQYRSILKGKSRQSTPQIKKEEEFQASLNDLFDIAHVEALELIKIPEDREFLQAQREPGRRGFMVGVDKVLAAKEERALHRCELLAERVKRSAEEQAELEETVELLSSAQSTSEDTDQDGAVAATSAPKKSCRIKNIITPELAGALDRTKVSDRSAVHILSATASALGHDPSDLAINRSSIRRSRRIQRKAIADEIQASYTNNTGLVIHWDGKLLPDDGKQKVDRLPVIVTDPRGTAKLLGVPKLPSGTGQATATAVMQCLEDWQLSEKVVGMSFDTTSSNTGSALGACTLLQQKLGRPLFYFACRHHILELVAEAAFATCCGPSSGPDIAIFKRFQSKWHLIDQSKFEPMLPADLDPLVGDAFVSCKEQVVLFCIEKLASVQPRDDYRELLELTIILFGECPPRGIRFMQPGAFHRARWMARMIYAIKIYLFRDQFKLTAAEGRGLKRFTTFVVTMYIRAWFSAPSAIHAPSGDLAFLKGLLSYPDSEIAKATSRKFANHLWYLSEDLAGLALFDETVEVNIKQLIVSAFKQDGQDNPLPRTQVDLTAKEIISTKTVADFVTSASLRIFEAFNITMDFLDKDPSEWENSPSFQSSQKVMCGIATVNDFAERGVALIQEYNQVLTKDEQQRQYLLQVVEQHRRQFPNVNKTAQTATSQD